MKRLLILLPLMLVLGGWNVHGVGYVTPNGYAQLNLGNGDVEAGSMFNNLFKSTYAYTPSGGAGPQNLDLYGIPINTTGWSSGNFSGAVAGLQSTGPYVIYWSANRTFSMELQANSVSCTFYNVTSSSGCSTSTFTFQTKGPSGGTSTCGGIGVPPGTGGCVIFSLASVNNPNNGNTFFLFPQAGTYASLPNNVVAGENDLVWVKQSNLASLVAGQRFTPEFLTYLRGINPKTLRTMGLDHWGNTFTNQSLWAYRNQPATFSWLQPVYAPSARDTDSGGIIGSAGSGSYPTSVDQYIAAGAADTPLTWTDGEVLQGIVTNQATRITVSGAVACTIGAGCSNNTDVLLTVSATTTLATNQPVWIAGVSGTIEANSSIVGGVQPTTITVVDGTHIELQGVNFTNAYSSSTTGVVGTQTINIASRGAKFIADEYGEPLYYTGAGDAWAASANQTFVYSATLGVVLYGFNNGVTQSVPWEVLADLANRVGSNLWINIPAWATDSYITSLATTLLGLLNPKAKLYIENANEVWDFSWPQTTYAQQIALVWGIPEGDEAGYLSWGGYRLKQITADFLAAGWTIPHLWPVMLFQETASPIEVQYYRMNGVSLGGQPTATITGISASATTPTVTINAISAPNPFTSAYQANQAVVLSGITGSGCTFLNGTTVFAVANTTTSFQLSSSMLGNNPISTVGCTYASGGTATPVYNNRGLSNYSSYPNRPVDTAQGIGYSAYGTGANFTAGNYTTSNFPALSTMATDWVNGSTATALALLDNDLKWGTTYSASSSTLTFTCPASSTTITVSNTLSNGKLIVFTTTGQTCGGLAVNTVYCVSGASGSGFSVVPILPPLSEPVGVACGTSPITVTNSGASGTQTVGVTPESTFAWLSVANMQWEWLAAQYDSDGRAIPLTVEEYEGGIQELAPTTSQCTTVGISTTNGATPVTFENTTGVGTPGVLWASSGMQNGDRVSFTVAGGSLPSQVGSGTNYFATNVSATGFDLSTAYYPLAAFAPGGTGSGTTTATICQGLDNLLDAYRNSVTYGQNYVTGMFNIFMGTNSAFQNYGLMLHSRTPSWLVFQGLGGTEYSLLPGTVYQAANSSLPPFQLYYGFAAWNSAYP